MKVIFTFKVNAGIDSTTKYKQFGNWTKPLPNIGDYVECDSIEGSGYVKRVEWDLDDLNQVYIIIN